MVVPFVDAHCHYFNLDYVVLETLSWMGLLGKSAPRSDSMRSCSAGRSDDDGLGGFVKFIVDLLGAATSSCCENYRREVDAYSHSEFAENWPELWTVPLMMDILYLCAPEPSCCSEWPSLRLRPRGDRVDELLAAHRERLQAMVEQAIRTSGVGEGGPADHAEVLLSRTKTLFDHLDQARKTISARVRSVEEEFPDVYWSAGYAGHLDDLRALSRKVNHTRSSEGNRVFPFLAIDPRRPGARRLLTARQDQPLVSSRGPFYGVKLYPALGYLPTHPELLPVYDHCARERIPITVHCSHGGLVTPLRSINVWSQEPSPGSWPTCTVPALGSEEETAAFFSDPGRWVPILGEYKQLKVNFAHFGGPDAGPGRQDGSSGWTDTILGLMEGFPDRVYADASYFCSEDVDSLKQILQNHDHAARHLMFGTDYVMILIKKGFGGLPGYFQTFHTALAEGRERLFSANARKFLGVS